LTGERVAEELHDAWIAINRDPRVMEFLGDPLTRQQSDALVDRIEAGFEKRGYGFWAVEVDGVTPFIGLVGLSVPSFDAPFMPAVEIGWRLDSAYWGNGYATEAACAALDYAFDALALGEVVSFTTQGNVRSRRVMERIGMTHDPRDDFEHPSLPVGNPLRPHVLYRIQRASRDCAACPTSAADAGRYTHPNAPERRSCARRSEDP